MKKRCIIFLLPILSLIGLLFASAPVFADPVTNPDDNSITEDTENIDNEPTPAENSTDAEERTVTCSDQLGAVSWLICPLTNTLASGIDWLYSGISDFLTIKPIYASTKSPVYLVWEYMRNATNIVFIVFILIIVYSQLTGFGLNNYGIKRTLPRIIIAAVLVNLSFIICAIGVDLSNILGSSLYHVFNNIQEGIMASGAGNEYLNNISVAEITGAILGTSGVAIGGTLLGLSIVGGIGAAIWMLLPVVLSAFIAVLGAFITVAARQALIMLLIMIAPVAFICFLLPNTEKWFDKWKSMFLQMLFFYPIFSVLFGASKLASWAILSSATGWLGIILGLAVQFLPLFMSFSLFKMSGSLPGKVGELFTKATSPIQKGAQGWSTSRHLLAKERHQTRGKTPSARLSRMLADRKTAQAEELAAYTASNRLRSQAFSANSNYNRKGQLNRRGERLYSLQGEDLQHQNTIKKLAADFDEGYDTERYGADSRIKNKRQYTRLKKANENIINAVDTSHLQDARAESIRFSNLENYADRINTALDANQRGEKTALYSEIEATSGAQGERGLNNIVASAIAAKERVRKDNVANYATLYGKLKTKDVLSFYDANLKNQNIDAIVALHEVLGFRGDYDKIGAKLQEYMDKDGWNVELGSDFSNTLASSLLGMKDKDPTLARLGKHINMETWRYSNADENDPHRRSAYVTMNEYLTGIDSKGEATKTGGVVKLLEGTSFKGIERTAFGNIQALLDNAHISDSEKAVIQEKVQTAILPQLLTAIPTFETNGEQIMNTLSFITGLKYSQDPTKDKRDPNNKFEWRGDSSTVRADYTKEYLSAFTPNDLISMKTNAFQATIAALTISTGSKAAAETEFKRIQEDNGNLKKLRAFEPNILSPMKDSILKILDIPLPPRGTP